MKKLIVFIISLCTFLLLTHTHVNAQNTPQPQTVTYCSPNGVPLLMDIYIPQTSPSTKFPVVMYVHGGGFTQGSRTLLKTGSSAGASTTTLLEKGYVIASIDYRLAPQHKFPAFIIDTKCAIRYLRANADKYDIDINRIGLIGDSAGGQLVALAGLAGKDAGWDIGEYPNQSSTPQAVVDLFGYSYIDKSPTAQLIIPIAFGNNQQLLMTAMPTNWIPKTPNSAPPFLLMHGDKDTVVPVSQSVDFNNKLQASGQDSSLVIVKNGEHGFSQSSQISPSYAELSDQIVAFFEEKLVPKTTTVPIQPTPSSVNNFFHCLGACPTATPTPVISPPTVTNAPQDTNGQFLSVLLILFLKLFVSIIPF